MPHLNTPEFPAPPHWQYQQDALVRRFQFPSFNDALRFMQQVSVYCNTHDHHPEWTNIYDRVDVTLITHDAGRVTEKDIALAQHMNTVFDQGFSK